MGSHLQIHKNGPAVINIRQISAKLREAVNRCAAAERKSQRDFCIDALDQAIKDSPLRLGMARIETRLTQGVTSRPDEAAAIAAQEKGGAA